MKSIDTLVLSTHGFGHGSMYPFVHYRNELKSRFNLTSKEVMSDSLQEKIRLIKEGQYDLIFICIPIRKDRTALLDFYTEVQNVKGHAKIIHFDYGDGHWSPHFGLVPYVDLYLKQFLNRNMDDYQKWYVGGCQITEYFVNNGLEESICNEIWTNLFQSKLPREHYDKVMLGWTFLLWQRMIYLAEGKGSIVLWSKDKPHKRLWSLAKSLRDYVVRAVTGVDKPIDVYCRAALYSGWTRQHRVDAIKHANELSAQYNVVSSQKYVCFSDYYREMRSSKIYVSPFGWCELTPKDYEAMYFNTLLLKPSCEHIDTDPNILIPGETYVPLKWDLSDLKEKCAYYLENEDERKRITVNARKAFLEYYESKIFLDRIEQILRKVGFDDG